MNKSALRKSDELFGWSAKDDWIFSRHVCSLQVKHDRKNTWKPALCIAQGRTRRQTFSSFTVSVFFFFFFLINWLKVGLSKRCFNYSQGNSSCIPSSSLLAYCFNGLQSYATVAKYSTATNILFSSDIKNLIKNKNKIIRCEMILF